MLRRQFLARKSAALPARYVVATDAALQRWDASLKRLVRVPETPASPRIVGLLLRVEG